MPMDIPEYQLPDPHEGNSPTLEQTDVVDTEQLANAILAGCASGGDISGHLATLGTLEHDQREILQRHIGKLLAEHTSMLSEPHHWMTLQKVGRQEYIAILRYALESASGIDHLTISTKLADTLRRETDTAKKTASLDEADFLFRDAIDTAAGDEREWSPEMFRALSSACYTQSFVSLGRAEMKTEGQAEEQNQLIQDSLAQLETSRAYAVAAGDHEGAAQSEIRWCAVHIDMNIGDMTELIPKLDTLAKKLQGASGTWANRFLNNALGRRVEAAAKCSHAQWEDFYRELMQRENLEKQYGGADKLKVWKEKNCPPALRKEEGFE